MEDSSKRERSPKRVLAALGRGIKSLLRRTPTRSPIKTRRRTNPPANNNQEESDCASSDGDTPIVKRNLVGIERVFADDNERLFADDNDDVSWASDDDSSSQSDCSSMASDDSITIEWGELLRDIEIDITEAERAVVDTTFYNDNPYEDSPYAENLYATETPAAVRTTNSNSLVSILHDEYKNDKVKFISFDFETGGEKCGILQISAVIARYDNRGPKPEFNSYVKPPDTAVWNKFAVDVHGLSKTSQEILSADPIETVWPKFVTFIEDNIAQSEVGVLCAYNGQACDLQWIFRLTKTTEYNLKLPERVDHFLDPFYVISHYKTCVLNTSKSKQENTKLATVYQIVAGVPLANAHDALADSKAQLKIVMSAEFKPFLDRTKSIKLLEEVWSHKVKTAAKTASEPTRAVVLPWKADSEEEYWKPPKNVLYESAAGGPPSGPSSTALLACRSSSFWPLFLVLLPMRILIHIVNETNRYAHQDWVVEQHRVDRDGNRKNSTYFKSISEK